MGDSPDDPGLRRRAVTGVRFNKAYALLSLSDCGDRDVAERLRGQIVMIDRDQALPLEAGEYYLFQLIGLKVVADGMEIGRIKEVLQTGANDVYVVSGERYGEALVPAHAETINSIDFASGIVSMTLPEGSLPQT